MVGCDLIGSHQLSEDIGIRNIAQRVGASRSLRQAIQTGIGWATLWIGVTRQSQSATRAHENQSVSMLRDAEVRGIQNMPRSSNCIAGRFKFIDELFENLTMWPDGDSLYIFKDEICSLQFADYADEFFDEHVSRIVECPLANQGKPLARRAAENDIDLPSPNTGQFSNFRSGKADDGARKHITPREIEFVDRAVNRVDFNGASYIETGLFEAETQPSGARKQIYPDRPHYILKEQMVNDC